MNNFQTRVASMLANAEGQRKFLAWLADDVTKLLLEAARERARPEELQGPGADPYGCLYQHGRSVGANQILDFISAPQLSAAGAGKPRELVPDYGSKAILERMADGNKT